ncbi:MAG TPA: poly-gamma-glutamate system protein [bacterium]|jgi:poly-gamma-glutamate system protein
MSRSTLRCRFLLAGLAVLWTVVCFAEQRHHAAYPLMIKAAQRTRAAEEALYTHKLALGLYDAELDPHRTGLVGVEYSRITTTIGNLKAKRTATNPDFAAYIVRELVDHGIGTGDTVLVTMTGSFPGMNLAVLMALETLNVASLRVCSLGASSYGANQEDFTWVDIEDYLVRQHLLKSHSNFVTLGGSGDVGGGISKESRWMLRTKAERLGYTILKSPSARKQAVLRREQLGNPRSYGLLINIGGNQAMLGGKEGRDLPGGWIEPFLDSLGRDEDPDEVEGIIFDFLEDGVPVLNLLHIEDIAVSAGIPFDPPEPPPIGVSALYFVPKPAEKN